MSSWPSWTVLSYLSKPVLGAISPIREIEQRRIHAPAILTKNIRQDKTTTKNTTQAKTRNIKRQEALSKRNKKQEIRDETKEEKQETLETGSKH
jgi:hypothetical protein